MVFESAHYKRQEDEEIEATERSVEHTHQRSSSSAQMNASSLENASASLISASSDHLCEPGEAMAGTAASGGRVRFVDSTVRYHMPNGAAHPIWTGRTRLEQTLLVLVAGLVFIISILMIVIGETDRGWTGSVSLTTHKHDDLCLSPECITVAASILSDIDPKVDPCEDFYKHACGGWEKLNPIPDGHSSWSMFEKLWERNQLVMKNALEEVDKKLPDENAKRKAYSYYVSCLDPNGTIEALNGKPLLNMIRTHLVGWHLFQRDPLPDSQESFDNETLMENFTAKVALIHHDLQADGFFSWVVGEDDQNSTLHVIQIDQGGLTLPTRDHYLKANYTPVVEALKKVMVRLVKLLIADDTEDAEIVIDDEWQARIRDEVEAIIEFETKLANITVPQEERHEDSNLYRRKALGVLHSEANFFNWTSYFQDAFKRVNKSITNETEVVMYGNEFIQALSQIIWTYQNTSQGRKTLDSYMKWHVIKFMRNALSKPYRDAGKILEKAMLGKEGHIERWRECVTDTDSALGYALGAIFVRKVFNGESKSEAQEMIDSVKGAFEGRLKNLSWMDDETREAALTKARAISDMIGYPSFIENGSELDEKYKGLEVSTTDYFGNCMASHVYSFMDNMRKLDKPVNRTKWSMTPPTVNAYYTPTKNQIAFPAGILQSPFFNVKYPKSINYGAMGVVMGHELSHAFDDQGSKYDDVGNKRDWWNNATFWLFKQRTECMEKQYSSYHISSQNVSGTLTLGENIADNGGLQTSFFAYKSWLAKQSANVEPPLPGLNHTHDQLFFLSFAQVWCSVSTPQANKLQLLEDSHSPARFRVLGVLSNFAEFANAFQCPAGSPMNPKHKCQVW